MVVLTITNNDVNSIANFLLFFEASYLIQFPFPRPLRETGSANLAFCRKSVQIRGENGIREFAMKRWDLRRPPDICWILQKHFAKTVLTMDQIEKLQTSLQFIFFATNYYIPAAPI